MTPNGPAPRVAGLGSSALLPRYLSSDRRRLANLGRLKGQDEQRAGRLALARQVEVCLQLASHFHEVAFA